MAALMFFTARDDATTSVPPAAAPGQPNSSSAPLPDDLRRGNVVVVADAANTAAAKQLAVDVAGPADPALRAAGQAVIVRGASAASGDPNVTCTDRRGRRGRCAGIVAYAQGRVLEAPSARDPQLRTFLEYWLGRAAG